MAEQSDIAWTTSTFNPWIGCTKVGPGCDGCYAEALDKRHKWGGAAHWGAGVPRYRTSENLWKQPLVWERKQTALLAADRATPPWRVFCASLADVFDNEVPAEWRLDLFKLIQDTPKLDWLLVTKRIGNVEKMLPQGWKANGFPPNVRLMITVVNQEEADRDVPKLLALPCKNGISYEPAIGLVDWSEWLEGGSIRAQVAAGEWSDVPRRRLQWIIVGGESGQGAHKARLFDLAWARSAVDQCKAAGVPVFVKQLGSDPRIRIGGTDALFAYAPRIKDRAGANPAEWPEDLRIQEFPA